MLESEIKTLLRTDADHPAFVELVRQLDAELAEIDGEDHGFYAQYNTLEEIRHAVLLKIGDLEIGCGAFKLVGNQSVEIKRMYVKDRFRSRGHAGSILRELEQWASELGLKRCVLETGLRQPEAIRLYERCGYRRIANFGPYKGIENSVCFEKILK